MKSTFSILQILSIFIGSLLLLSCEPTKKNNNEILEQNDTNNYSSSLDTKQTEKINKKTLLDSINEIENPKAKQMALGEYIYKRKCAMCHQEDGSGKKTYFPPLRKSDFFANDPLKAVKVVLSGHSGPIEVNGKPYNLTMDAQDFNDEEIASVVTYVLNNFENNGGEITSEQVTKLRNKTK